MRLAALRVLPACLPHRLVDHKTTRLCIPPLECPFPPSITSNYLDTPQTHEPLSSLELFTYRSTP
jgi:hypothetical protein